MSARPHTMDVYETTDGWRWRKKSTANGKNVSSGEAYPSKANAWRGAIAANPEFAPLPEPTGVGIGGEKMWEVTGRPVVTVAAWAGGGVSIEMGRDAVLVDPAQAPALIAALRAAAAAVEVEP